MEVILPVPMVDIDPTFLPNDDTMVFGLILLDGTKRKMFYDTNKEYMVLKVPRYTETLVVLVLECFVGSLLGGEFNPQISFGT